MDETKRSDYLEACLLYLNRMAGIIFKNLETYRAAEIARITQTLILLHCQNPEIFSRLRIKLLQ